MADLNPDRAGHDRGQMLLVGAFAFALLLVALAFVLNGAAYTENLATRGQGSHDVRDAVRFQDAVERSVPRLVAAANRRNDTSYAALDTAFTDTVSDWSGLAAREHAQSGTAASVAIGRTTNGSRIRQGTPRSFADANGTRNWTLARSVTDTRGFRMNLSRDGLAANCTDGCFRAVASNGTATWRASVTGNATAVSVTVDGPTGNETCTVTGDEVSFDLSTGSVGGTCEVPPIGTGLAGPYDVAYVNGGEGEGIYELRVDAVVSNDSRYGTDPSVSPMIYAADVTVRYRTSRLNYTTELRVVPGERDA